MAVFATFDLQVTPYFQPSFESNGLSVQEKKSKTDFQDGGHLKFLIWTFSAILNVQAILILPIKFWVLAFPDQGES